MNRYKKISPSGSDLSNNAVSGGFIARGFNLIPRKIK
jgi:hypothetical protein